MENWGCPRSEDVLHAGFQDCQADLDQPMSAAPAPTYRLFLGHGPAMTRLTLDSTTAVEMRWPEAVTLRIAFRARGGVEAGIGAQSFESADTESRQGAKS